MKSTGIITIATHDELCNLSAFINQDIFNDLENMTVVLVDELNIEVSNSTQRHRDTNDCWYKDTTCCIGTSMIIADAICEIMPSVEEKNYGTTKVCVTLCPLQLTRS